MGQAHAQPWRAFAFRIVTPVIVAILLFVVALYAIIIPEFERNMLDRKREMIRELTHVAWSELAQAAVDEEAGLLTREEAQALAMERVRAMRYGDERKDYFWITDTVPRGVMHPYREELEGADLRDYRDPKGKRLFVEMVEVVSGEAHEGFIDYEWQWKDDSAHIVPKLSYVQRFEPWGWVIGTGIYVEDVKREVSLMTSRLALVSLVIISCIAALLFFLVHQSKAIEQGRQEAEADLRRSEEKYRLLAEASSEGLLLATDGELWHINRKLSEMLGYGADDVATLTLSALLRVAPDDAAGQRFLAALQTRAEHAMVLEAQLVRRDGTALTAMLTLSPVELLGKAANIVVVRDLDMQARLQALDEAKQPIQRLADGMGWGILRFVADTSGRIMGMSEGCRSLFGLEPGAAIPNDFSGLMLSKSRWNEVAEQLRRQGQVRDARLTVLTPEGTRRTLHVAAILEGSPEDKRALAVVQDVSAQIQQEAESEAFVANLRTAHAYLSQPCHAVAGPAVRVDFHDSAQGVARALDAQAAKGAILTTPAGVPCAIVTDGDLRRRVIAPGRALATEAHAIMSAPLVAVDHDATLFEALLELRTAGVEHLVVRHPDGDHRLLRPAEVMATLEGSPFFLHQSIPRAQDVEALAEIHAKVHFLTTVGLSGGLHTRSLTRFVTAVADAILHRLVALVSAEVGPPPLPWAWMALGSQARHELTPRSDQDNAIVYLDDDTPAAAAHAAYFLRFGQALCDGLTRVGYVRCPGAIMASEPACNMSLRGWKERFEHWILHASPQDLLDVHTFFDHRVVVGDATLVEALRHHALDTVAKHPPFLGHLARNATTFRVGRNLGTLLTSELAAPQAGYELKNAIGVLVAVARTYALRHGLHEIGTYARLESLVTIGAMTQEDLQALRAVLALLTELRLRHQLTISSREGWRDTTLISEQALIKRALAQITAFQNRLSFDFFGHGL